MAIPLPVLMAAVNAMQTAARSRQMDTRRQSEIALERERLRREALHAAAESERFRTEAALQDRHRERQKEVLLRMIEVADGIHRIKIEVIQETFREVMAMLKAHQEGLLQEQRQLSDALLNPAATQTIRLHARKRQREVSDELEELDQAAMQVQQHAVDTLATIKPGQQPHLLDW